jgi:phenylalanyl-tRNA synthetase beta chain
VPSVDDYNERTSLDLFITGKTGKESWNHRTNPSDFFYIKSATEMVLSRLGINTSMLVNGESFRRYFAESVTYTFDNKLVAETGRISKGYLAKFDIGQDVFYSHVDWDQILKIIKNNTISYRELPKFPSVRRDLAILLDKKIKFGQIKEIAFMTEKNVLREVGLFDVYESESLGPDKKSYAVSFLLRDNLKTMTDKNIEKVMNNLIRAFETELNAKIR